jgi:type I restriction enzyme S subunit
MSGIIGQRLPPGWVQGELSAIAQINPPLDRCILNDNVIVDFIPMRAVEPEGGGILRPEVSTYGKVKKGYTAFLPGDVITAKITPCMENGKTCLVPQLPGAACFGSTEFHVVRTEGNMDARWVANFLLQHSTRHAAQRQMMGGVGQMRVPSAFVETLKIPVPPGPEQQRILDTLDELLSDLDAGVAALERVQAKLKHYRAAVLKAAVEGGLTVDWRAQHPGTEPASALLQRILAERRSRWEEVQLEKFKAAGREPPKDWKAKYQDPATPDTTNLPTLPQDWCWATVDQLGDVGTGATPNRGMKELYYNNGTIPWVTSGCVNTSVVREPSEYVTAHALNECNLTQYPPGTLLLAMYGEGKTRGMCAELQIASTTNQALAAIQAHPLAKDFLRLFLLKNYHDTRRAATGGVQPNLNLGMVRSITLPFPPCEEQPTIVEAVEDQLSVIDHLDADLAAKLKSAQGLRQSILRHAFAGQLAPQDTNDEPASELLKQIAVEREERARQAAAASQIAKKAKPTKARLKKPRHRDTVKDQYERLS